MKFEVISIIFEELKTLNLAFLYEYTRTHLYRSIY